MTREGFAGYLAVLKGAGFALKGYVLYSDSQGEQDAQARAQRGDIDEVVAIKGRYELTISAPGSDGSVSFDADGLTEAEAKAMIEVTVMIHGSPDSMIIAATDQS